MIKVLIYKLLSNDTISFKHVFYLADNTSPNTWQANKNTGHMTASETMSCDHRTLLRGSMGAKCFHDVYQEFSSTK